MWQLRVRIVTVLLAVVLAGCGIAETKLPPDPTVEYLPCSGPDLEMSDRVDPFTVLLDISPTLEQDLWGGLWTVGDEWHIGLTDVGAVDWEIACPEIGDRGLFAHEVPFVLEDLETWESLVHDRISGATDPDRLAVDLNVLGGQYVLEIRAERVEDAAGLTEGIPADAWAYGGKLPERSG